MKYLRTIAISFVLLMLVTVTVKAQYDTDFVQPTYQDNKEIFGIDTQKGKSVVFYPEGCKSINRITIKFKNDVKGQIQVQSHGTDTPVQGKDLPKTYEYCELNYVDIQSSDIDEISVDAKVRKSWFDSVGVNDNDVAVYTYGTDNWENNTTTRDTDNSIYVFYNSKVKFSKYLAVAEYTNKLPFQISPIAIIVCCLLLLLLLLIIAIIASLLRRNRESRNVTYNTNNPQY